MGKSRGRNEMCGIRDQKGGIRDHKSMEFSDQGTQKIEIIPDPIYPVTTVKTVIKICHTWKNLSAVKFVHRFKLL